VIATISCSVKFATMFTVSALRGPCARTMLDIVELAGNVTRGTARNARYRTAACVDKRRLIR
jgi:hypothetical protein